jgi:peroxiredoxin (alkyl hydroperoxide reductase subunit C)
MTRAPADKARPDAERPASASQAILEPGTPVPEFMLRREDGSEFTQEDLLGHTTVLVFYPFAFSRVCTDQLNLYEELLGDLRAQGATLYGVSCDATYSQSAFREKLGVSIEQLSDFEPKGAVCQAFGVYHPGGFPQRALVIVGSDAVVKWSYQAPSPIELPGANLIFDGLAAAAA